MSNLEKISLSNIFEKYSKYDEFNNNIFSDSSLSDSLDNIVGGKIKLPKFRLPKLGKKKSSRTSSKKSSSRTSSKKSSSRTSSKPSKKKGQKSEDEDEDEDESESKSNTYNSSQEEKGSKKGFFDMFSKKKSPKSSPTKPKEKYQSVVTYNRYDDDSEEKVRTPKKKTKVTNIQVIQKILLQMNEEIDTLKAIVENLQQEGTKQDRSQNATLSEVKQQLRELIKTLDENPDEDNVTNELDQLLKKKRL